MKKVVLAIFSVLIVLSMVACSMKPTTSSPTESTTSTKTATKKIGFLVPTLQSEFFINLVDGVTKNLKEKGYTVETTSFEMDSSKAVSAIENYTVGNVDEIIAMVADGSTDEALKAAMDKGIKVMALGVETKYYDHLMVADNTDVGTKIAEMAADFVNETYGGKTEIAVITSTQSTDMARRSDGIVETLQKLLPDSTIVMKQDAMKPGDGYTFAENVLQKHPETKVIVSYGDAMALEAVEAFKAAGKTGDGYAAFGCDLTQQGLKEIAAGSMFSGTVDMGDLVEQVSDSSYRLAIGDETLDKKFIGTNKKVTIENVNEYLNK